MSSDSYSLDVGAADLHRMTLLGNIYKDYNTKFIHQCGITQGMHIADIGCGPGNMSLWFANQVGPTGSVTAVDNSDEQLSLVVQRAVEHNISHIVPKKLDIYELSEHFNQQFDIVFCRFLIIHLKDPLKALTQLKKIVKPKGHLIVCELDNHTWSSLPANSYLQKDVKLQSEVGLLRAIDLDVGKKLYAYFRQLQMINIKVEIAQPVLQNENRQYLISKVQAWGKKYIEHNLLNEMELNELMMHIKQLVASEAYLLLGAQMYQVAGTPS